MVCGGIGRATRAWDDIDRIFAARRALASSETLPVQSGKPVGVFKTHADAPPRLIANFNLEPSGFHPLGSDEKMTRNGRRGELDDLDHKGHIAGVVEIGATS